MKILILALVSCFLAGGLLGCSGIAAPTATLRLPILFDTESPTVAGERLRQAPTYYAPTYQPAAGPSGFAGPCR